MSFLAILAVLTAAPAHGLTQDSLSPQAQEAAKLLDAPDLTTRQLGFLQLEALRDPSTSDLIRQHLQSRDADTRAFSARALAAVEHVKAVPTLLEILKSDRHPRVRVAAVLGVEPLPDPAVLPALIQALRDRHALVRMAAADAVSRSSDPSAHEAIRTRWQRERHRDVRRVLKLAMERIGAS